MADPFTLIILATITSVAGQVVSTLDTIATEKDRQRQLDLEMTNVKLQALDEENERLQELSFANSSIIANSGNIDPFASMSLIAARSFNFRQNEGDLSTIQTNLAASRAQIATQISISKRNIRTAKVTGLLGSFDAVLSGAQASNALKKPSTAITKKKKVTKKKGRGA